MGRMKKHLRDRFEAKVVKSDGCWLWQAHKTWQGYGKLVGGDQAPGEQLAHRCAYIIYRGPIPKGLCVLHRCDNPPCVNPAHLFLGTVKDNCDDMNAKGRRHSSKGELNPAAKITKEIADEICWRYENESINQTELAREYGLSQQHVSKIVRRIMW